MDDHQLLTAYARHADQGAFAQLVHRHVDLVYAAALRQTRGDRHLAEDVTQATFLILAQKAGRLPPGVVLAGWLHATARYAAANAIKERARRRRRETRRAQMDAPPTRPAQETEDDLCLMLATNFQNHLMERGIPLLSATHPSRGQASGNSLEWYRPHSSVPGARSASPSSGYRDDRAVRR